MKNIYYQLWSDAILSFRKHNPNRNDWKLTLLTFISWINALNLWIIMLWLKFFKILVLPHIHIAIFPGKLLNDFLSFAIIFALPFFILNYFLIFYNKRYERIISKYSNLKTRFALIYSISIALLAFLSALLYGALQ